MFLHSTGNINRVKRKPKKWKKIAANYKSDKWLVSKFYKGTQHIIFFFTLHNFILLNTQFYKGTHTTQ